MLAKHAKALQTLRKHLPEEAVDALAQILSNTTAPIEPAAPMLFNGVAGQSTRPWTAKRTVAATDKNALEVGDNAVALFSGNALGVGKWCKTVADWTVSLNPRSGVTEFRVECRDANDEQGLRTTGTTYTVYLNVTGGAQPNLNVGDSLFFFYAGDGLRVAWPSQLTQY